jgi:hypothetical protein
MKGCKWYMGRNDLDCKIKIKGNVAMLAVTGHSSDGRAIDCRSIGPVFDSQCPDLT